MEVQMKNILYQFIEGQTHFGMPRGTKMSLTLNELLKVALHTIQTLPPSMHHKWKEFFGFLSKTTSGKV